jgi:tetratricopeptide (TPR) repeat protein
LFLFKFLLNFVKIYDQRGRRSVEIEEIWLKAELHRGVYIATLSKHLARRGAKKAFAKQIGIRPEYLSYLLDPQGARTPGLKLAKRIAAALPLDKDEQQTLFEHLVLANEHRVKAQHTLQVKYSRGSAQALCNELIQLNRDQSFITDPDQLRQRHALICKTAPLLLEHGKSQLDPLTFAHICTILCSNLNVLHHLPQALWHAHYALKILEDLDDREYRGQREVLADLHISAARSRGMVYQSMGLDKQALDCFEQVEALQKSRAYQGTAAALALIGKLRAMVGVPRFAISEAEALVRQMHQLSEGGLYSEQQTILNVHRIREALARAYIKHGSAKNLRQAGRILVDESETLKKNHFSPMLHTALFRTSARLALKQGDVQGWQHLISRSVQFALEADLRHQISSMKSEFGLPFALVLQQQQPVNQEEIT